MKYVLSAIVAVLATAFAVQPASAQSVALTNSDVMRLVLLHIPDRIVIAVINAAPVTQLDVSESAVRDLSLLGVSRAVIAAMRQPSAPPAMVANQPAPPAVALPTPASDVVVPRVAATNFEPLYRAAKAVQGATQPGVTYAKFGELLQTFSTELSIAKDHASNDDERELVASFDKAYEAYRFSDEIWKVSLSTPGAPISATSFNVQSLMEFHLRIENLSTFAGRTPVIPAGSMQRVWAEAEVRLARATALYLAR